MKVNDILKLLLMGFILGAPAAALADKLILSNEKRIDGEISLIANDYIEFKTDQFTGETEWIKIEKQKVLAVLDAKGKIVYPRDKFDENVLNYGKVRLQNKSDLAKYRARKRENITNQLRNEKAEKKKYKVAAIIGGIAGLMVFTISNGM